MSADDNKGDFVDLTPAHPEQAKAIKPDVETALALVEQKSGALAINHSTAVARQISFRQAFKPGEP